MSKHGLVFSHQDWSEYDSRQDGVAATANSALWLFLLLLLSVTLRAVAILKSQNK